MNQILSTSMPVDNRKKVRNSQPIDIKNIVKIFAVILIVFGTLMVGTGTYAIFKNQSTTKEQNLEPSISIENKTDTSILLKITHQRNIEKVEYGWNDEARTTIEGNGGKYIEQEIDIPSGSNTLHVIIIDEEGNETTYEKQYELDSDINIEVSGNKIKITYSGDKEISYMTYRWDDEEEERIDINDSQINEEIEAIKGLHKLTVSVVDVDNNMDTKTQKINGVSKPEIEIDIDDNNEHFIIRASDDEKLERIELILNYNEDKKYIIDLSDKDMKELEYTLPIDMEIGDNILEATVYNSNNISSYSGVKFVKE